MAMKQNNFKMSSIINQKIKESSTRSMSNNNKNNLSKNKSDSVLSNV